MEKAWLQSKSPCHLLMLIISAENRVWWSEESCLSPRGAEPKLRIIWTYCECTKSPSSHGRFNGDELLREVCGAIKWACCTPRDGTLIHVPFIYTFTLFFFLLLRVALFFYAVVFSCMKVGTPHFNSSNRGSDFSGARRACPTRM